MLNDIIDMLKKDGFNDYEIIQFFNSMIHKLKKPKEFREDIIQVKLEYASSKDICPECGCDLIEQLGLQEMSYRYCDSCRWNGK